MIIIQGVPYKSVVTIPNFGSEGHGVQPRKKNSYFMFQLALFCGFPYNLPFLLKKKLRANVPKNQRFSKNRGNSQKLNSAHIFRLGRP